MHSASKCFKYATFICSNHKALSVSLNSMVPFLYHPINFFFYICLRPFSITIYMTHFFNCLPFLITLAVACPLVSTPLFFLSSCCVFCSLHLPAYYLFSFSPRLLVGYNCCFAVLAAIPFASTSLAVSPTLSF